MTASNADWDARIAAVWASVQSQSLSGEALVATVDALAAERSPGDATALFERACARDTAGIEDDAEVYYRAALATGQLDAYRSSRASIQLASTLRILGYFDESEQLLIDELDRHLQPGNSRALHDEARAVLALPTLRRAELKRQRASRCPRSRRICRATTVRWRGMRRSWWGRPGIDVVWVGLK